MDHFRMPGSLLRQLRRLLWTSIFVFALLAVLLPPIFGARVRLGVESIIADANASSLPFQVHVIHSRKGWFSSDYQLLLAGQADTIPMQLSILHGPVLWHLHASPLAIAELRLEPDPLAPPETVRYLSASGMLTLTGLNQVSFRSIAGFTALGGEHWLEADARWPWAARRTDPPGQWPEAVALDLWIDADARALADGPYADLLADLRAERRVRVSAGRVLGHVKRGEIR